MKAFLIYDTPEHDANLMYWGRFSTPDPFLGLRIEDKTIAVVSMLEYERCRQESTFHAIYLQSDLLKKAEKRIQDSQFGNLEKIILLLKEKYAIDSFSIPNSFPASLYASLKEHISLEFDSEFFRTQRAYKTPLEIEQIRQACQLTSKAILHAKSILKQSQIQADQTLLYRQKLLTAERLRQAIEMVCLKQGGRALRTIVSGGRDSANPHCEGSGPLHAHELIVIDVFPQLTASGYYGDMTRTFLKGQASPQQKKLWQCVYDCQKAVIKRIRPGVRGEELMHLTEKFFENNGFGLRRSKSGFEGFIHGLGHGVGLDLHEYPSIGNRSVPLEPNMVFTVEPGLYFQKLGGVRIEDVVQVTETGCQLLSRCPYTWIV